MPYVCSVRFQLVHRCCAAILNANWLLTSGHCTADLAGVPDAITIVCGIRMYRTVVEIVPHPDFQAAEASAPYKPAANDLALLAEVSILSFCACQHRLGPVLGAYLEEGNICTDNTPMTIATGGGTSTCAGDSGAPVMIAASDLQPYTLLAVPSWTVAPCVMKSITLVLWAIAAIVAAVGAAPERRIFGGTDALEGELPYQVSIQRAFLTSRSHICGGTILNPLHVLTAASCFWSDSTSRFEVVAGNLRIDRVADTQQVLGVFWIRMHPGFTGGTSSFDVAVVRTSSAFFFTDLIRPVALPPFGEIPTGLVRVGGWGSTNNSILPGNNFSNVLQKINVLIVPWNECLSVLGGPGGPFDERNICTGPLSGGISTCTGDAGGGAVQHLANGEFLQVGIITWNVLPCGGINTPSIYTRVSAFVDWIEANSAVNDGNRPQQRLIGGVRALPGEFPSMVSIQRLVLVRATHVCGGSVLNQFHVLTAAECFYTNPSNRYRVQAGKVLLNNFEPTEQTINVLRVTMHPQYDGTANPFDIAIVRLASPFGFNQFITPVVLPAINTIPDGIVKFAGWGSTSGGLLPSMPDQLQMFQVAIMPNEQCQVMVGGAIGTGPVTDRNVCLGPATGGIGACTGDAGGAVIQQINGVDTIVGIVSWQLAGCGQPGNPTITTRVSAFIEWINQNSQI
uniref:Peptidase S1 domain-containing protein n=1 Tax=Anopheles epiroticus TaxID=199890 RepID=A0A182PPS0_9DIPT